METPRVEVRQEGLDRRGKRPYRPAHSVTDPDDVRHCAAQLLLIAVAHSVPPDLDPGLSEVHHASVRPPADGVGGNNPKEPLMNRKLHSQDGS